MQHDPLRTRRGTRLGRTYSLSQSLPEPPLPDILEGRRYPMRPLELCLVDLAPYANDGDVMILEAP